MLDGGAKMLRQRVRIGQRSLSKTRAYLDEGRGYTLRSIESKARLSAAVQQWPTVSSRS